MPTLIFPGRWYRSKQALDRIKGLNTADQKPHVTPDGYAVLIAHGGGGPAVSLDSTGLSAGALVTLNGQPVPMDPTPCLHIVRDVGPNLEHVVTEDGKLVVKTVKIPIDGLGDLEPLVEFDHLPESRKDYRVYPRGHKLA